MEFKNRNWLYKKGKVFVHKKWGTLVRVTAYSPQTAESAEKVSFEEVNTPTPRLGECFGDIQRYLYDIDREINGFDKSATDEGNAF